VWNQGKLLPCQQRIEPEALSEETIFDHIRKKSKIFPVLDDSKTIELKLIAPSGNYAFDGCESSSQNQVLQTAFTISNPPDAVHIRSNAASGVTKAKDMFCGSSTNGRDKMVTATEGPDPGLLLAKDRLVNRASFAENNEDQPSSAGSLNRQCCLSTTMGSVRIEDSFLGFKSIFSFL
jgi:hypothetical protein